MASTVLHVAALVALIGWASYGMGSPPASSTPRQPALVFLPATKSRLPVEPAATAKQRTRVSVGERSDRRLRELTLTRDADLTQVARGVTKDEVTSARAADRDTRVEHGPDGARARAVPQSFPNAHERVLPSANDAQGERARLDLPGAIARAVARGGTWGHPNGTPEGVGPLQFDPRGADFTRWIQHFKTEVYRNWMVPQSVSWGWGGRVGFIFELDRQGRLVSLLSEGTTGTAALDRAAGNALQASNLLPLPSDYGPGTVMMKVTFDYGPDRRSASGR